MINCNFMIFKTNFKPQNTKEKIQFIVWNYEY